MSQYTCINKGTEETNNCLTCCGIINSCGMYENKFKTNPFEEFYNQCKKAPNLEAIRLGTPESFEYNKTTDSQQEIYDTEMVTPR